MIIGQRFSCNLLDIKRIILIFAVKTLITRLMSEEKRAKIISLIRDTIREAEPTAQIILYGSRARGDAREDSDWDVLAIVDKPRLSLSDRSRLQYPVWDKGLDMGEEINVFSYTRKQWEQAPPSLFKHNVMSEGITL
ncbi:MAG: nucleotidyltransferase domain-containing protein [Prevotella sp.]|nr:nucleotidyltransferase domain-containing protein [Prevotella sp.]